MYIAFILIFSCMTVPYRLALIKEDNQAWKIINLYIDVNFLLDILIIFNRTIFDEDFNLITNRKTIAVFYL